MKPTSLDDLALRLSDLEHRLNAATRRARRAMAVAVLAVAVAAAWCAMPEARAQFGLTLVGLNARLQVIEAKVPHLDAVAGLDTRLKAIETKTKPISLAGTNLRISGVNVHIVDGTGKTPSGSSLGNLTIGYNELRLLGDDRSGSHNLILGDQNNYMSSGGLVAGYRNVVSGNYATVTGGTENTANAESASVTGGENNLASGKFASVTGGRNNTANAESASVTGGTRNTASGPWASVQGGAFNEASAHGASVSGGANRTAWPSNNWAAGQYYSSQ